MLPYRRESQANNFCSGGSLRQTGIDQFYVRGRKGKRPEPHVGEVKAVHRSFMVRESEFPLNGPEAEGPSFSIIYIVLRRIVNIVALSDGELATLTRGGAAVTPSAALRPDLR
jgi:hypothetical protein